MVADVGKVLRAEAGEGYWNGTGIDEIPGAEDFDPGDQSR